jgi:hypothetical protein
MSLEAFRTALDQLPETSSCEGSVRATERLAIALPDGDVGAVDDPRFVDWLVAHAEVAPFGQGGATKVDAKVRDARRLIARGAAAVTGFEPAQVLAEIEAALSPAEHLEARLTDVLVYRKGGHFARHKDTPREAGLVGTLVVGLPVAHAGGAFHITDGVEPRIVDWSGKSPDRGAVRWVAMFGDVDHEIKPVTSGARVTLVYALVRSGRPRAGGAGSAFATFNMLAERIPLPPRGPLLILCARHIITEDETQPQGLDVLRGMDRAIADAFVAHGYRVSVRSCVTAAMSYNRQDTGRLRSGDTYSIARLSKAMSPKVIAELDNVVTFIDIPEDDEDYGQTLAPYILDQLPMDRCVIRRSAAATLIHESQDFSEDGNYGNEGYAAHIYTLAAIEVARPPAKPARKAPPKKVAKAAKKPAKKSGPKRR